MKDSSFSHNLGIFTLDTSETEIGRDKFPFNFSPNMKGECNSFITLRDAVSLLRSAFVLAVHPWVPSLPPRLSPYPAFRRRHSAIENLDLRTRRMAKTGRKTDRALSVIIRFGIARTCTDK
jgi:hypothetical protein